MKGLFERITLRDIFYYATVLIVIGISYGSIVENTKHRVDSNVHMPLDEKAEFFVTRKEYIQFREDVIDRLFERLDVIDERLNKMQEAK